jgi:hypothetical protein
LTRAGRALELLQLEDDELWRFARALAEGLTDAAKFVHWQRPIHLLVLDPQAHPAPLVWLLPSRRPAALAARLIRTHRVQARPLPGLVVVAPSEAAFRAVADYGRALSRTPPPAAAAVVARLSAARLLAKAGVSTAQLEQKLGALSFGLALALGDMGAAKRLEKTLRRLLRYAAATREVGVSLDLSATALTLRLFATARPGGALQRYIAGQRAARLPARETIPRRALAALRLGGRPTRTVDGGSVALSLLLSLAPAQLRDPLQKLAERLLRRRATWALVRGPGRSMCLVGLVPHPKPASLQRETLQRLRQVVAAGQGLLVGSGSTLQWRPIPAREHHTIQHRLTLENPQTKQAAPLGGLLRLLGAETELTVALRATRDHLVLALGPGAEKALVTAVARLKRPAALPSRAEARRGRLGWLTVSLGGLARLARQPLSTVKAQAPALHLHWGARPGRCQVDLTLSLPLKQLVQALSLVESLADRYLPTLPLTPPEEEPEDAL